MDGRKDSQFVQIMPYHFTSPILYFPRTCLLFSLLFFLCISLPLYLSISLTHSHFLSFFHKVTLNSNTDFIHFQSFAQLTTPTPFSSPPLRLIPWKTNYNEKSPLTIRQPLIQNSAITAVHPHVVQNDRLFTAAGPNEIWGKVCIPFPAVDAKSTVWSSYCLSIFIYLSMALSLSYRCAFFH